jgi:tripartite-type tricarboxylate transporter receptor subunit TctC
MIRTLLCSIAFALLADAALAQTFPGRPVRVIIPFPPGGAIDILVRAASAELSSRWGQPVVVDNRPGAAGNIGVEAAARAPADGHTLLATINPTFTSHRFLYRTLPYDPDRSFVPITAMASGDLFVLAHPSLPVKDLKELVHYAKSRPGSLAYGSYGKGSQPQLVLETLNAQAGLDLMHVPYKGIAPAVSAGIAGEVQLVMASAGTAGPSIRAGLLKPLAIASARRAALFPDVPTTAEAGYPDLLATVRFALFAPTGTPPVIVQKIGDDVRQLLRGAAFAEKHVHARGMEVVAGSAEDLAAAIRQETPLMGAMIRFAGLEPE